MAVKTDKIDRAKESYSDKAKRLALVVLQDEQLQGIIFAWPEMSDKAKAVCVKLARLDDE